MSGVNGVEKKRVVIIGAGERSEMCVLNRVTRSGIYGMSTALWMLKDGRYDVTILDKCGILPAPDAASTDINKVCPSHSS